MKILWIGGTHPRHLYYANTIHEKFPFAGAIVEERENVLPEPPLNIEEKDRKNFIYHFQKRFDTENKFFGDQKTPNTNLKKINPEGLNTSDSVKFVKSIDPDICLVFGCDLIKSPLAEALPNNTINLHLGLSPRYRGSATLFWPFYFMEPNFSGGTFHHIISEPDAGDIIHQVVPKLEAGDGIHDVACKVVIEAAREMTLLLESFQKHGSWKRFRQKSTGKNFLTSNFKPEHLRVIYDLFDDDIVDQHLEGKLTKRTPKLIRQWAD